MCRSKSADQFLEHRHEVLTGFICPDLFAIELELRHIDPYLWRRHAWYTRRMKTVALVTVTILPEPRKRNPRHRNLYLRSITMDLGVPLIEHELQQFLFLKRPAIAPSLIPPSMRTFLNLTGDASTRGEQGAEKKLKVLLVAPRPLVNISHLAKEVADLAQLLLHHLHKWRLHLPLVLSVVRITMCRPIRIQTEASQGGPF